MLEETENMEGGRLALESQLPSLVINFVKFLLVSQFRNTAKDPEYLTVQLLRSVNLDDIAECRPRSHEEICHYAPEIRCVIFQTLRFIFYKLLHALFQLLREIRVLLQVEEEIRVNVRKHSDVPN